MEANLKGIEIEGSKFKYVIREQFRSSSTILFLILVGLVLFATFASPNFLKLQNLLNLTRIVSHVGIIAMGITFVLLVGEIDLSVGAIMSVSAVLGGQFLDLGIIPVLVVTYLTGIVLGFINGLGTVKGNVPSIIMTLGTLILYSGLAHIVAPGGMVLALYTYHVPSYNWIGIGQIMGIPFPIIVFGTITIFSIIILHFHRFGRWIYYIGANRKASSYSGGHSNRVRIITFVISGFFASITGPMISGAVHQIYATQGAGYELDAIFVAVLGGASIFGGKGTPIGTLIAALIFACLINLLNLTGVATYLQQVVKGILMIIVVGLMYLREQR